MTVDMPALELTPKTSARPASAWAYYYVFPDALLELSAWPCS